MKTRKIHLTQLDMERLRALIEIYSGGDSLYVERLEEELDRAKIVDSKDIPGDVVTMNSVVRIRDLDTGEEKMFTLVFPGKSGESGKTVSILAPVGTAIIGYREGDVIEWEVPAGKKRIEILEIIYQPERVGNYDL